MYVSVTRCKYCSASVYLSDASHSYNHSDISIGFLLFTESQAQSYTIPTGHHVTPLWTKSQTHLSLWPLSFSASIFFWISGHSLHKPLCCHSTPLTAGAKSNIGSWKRICVLPEFDWLVCFGFVFFFYQLPWYSSSSLLRTLSYRFFFK